MNCGETRDLRLARHYVRHRSGYAIRLTVRSEHTFGDFCLNLAVVECPTTLPVHSIRPFLCYRQATVHTRIPTTGLRSAMWEFNGLLLKGNRFMYQPEDILEGARSIRPYLRSLLASDADMIDREVVDLLGRAQAGEKVGNLLLDVLS